MKNLKHILLAILTLWGANALQAAPNKVIDEVVWIVGDEPILKSEIASELLRLRYEKESVGGDPQCVIPEQMALQKLFIAQAKLDSLTVSETVLSQQVEARIKYLISQIGSKEKLEEYFNKPLSKIKETMEQSVSDQLLAQQMQEKIVEGVKISPADVKRFYAELPKDSIPIIPAQVEVQIITQTPSPTAAEIERVKSQLRDYREKIERGDYQFSTLAILYSEDRGSAMQGGELGFMTRGKLVSEFANTAFSLYDPTKVSRIVETEFGFHIIQLIERKNDQVNCRHILLTPKIGEAQQQATLLRLDSLANDIRAGKFSFEEAALYLSDNKSTNQNGGLMINEQSGTSKFRLQDLPQDIARAVSELEIGEISKPFIYLNTQGKPVTAIVRLKSRKNAHSANPNDDFPELKNTVTAKKNQELIEQWIVKKQAETYIFVNEEYSHCNFRYPGWLKKEK